MRVMSLRKRPNSRKVLASCTRSERFGMLQAATDVAHAA